MVDTAGSVRDGRAVIIVNTRSRMGRAWLRPAHEALKNSGLDLVGFHAVRDPRRLRALVRDAVKSDVQLVIVGGGDGTLSVAAAEIKGTSSVLGILPLGTGNALARDLGIPQNLKQACEIIVSGVEAKIDVGLAGDRTFVNIATVGLSTGIAEQLTVEAKRRFGRMVYAAAILRALAVVRPFSATIETPDGTQTMTTLQIVIGNGRRHAGPFLLSPEASITDGRLEIYALEGRSRGAFFKLALHSYGGHQVDLPEVFARSAPYATLRTQPIRRVTKDGEIDGRTPMRFESLPGALRIMVAEGAL